jgi:hypothetical protein
MAFSDYSTTPASNTTIGGVSIVEGCAAGNVNDAIRQLMSDGKALDTTVAAIDTSGFMPKSGGAFTGQITRSGRGGYLHHANSTQSGGKISILTSGSARPSSPSEGDMVFYY